MNLWNRLRPIWQPFWNRRISLYASSACFYMTLSLLPSLVLILSLLLRFSITEQSLTSFLAAILPSRFLPVLNYIKDQLPLNSSAAFSFSLFTLLWSASKGTLSIAEGLENADESKRRKGFLLRRIWGVVYFLLLWAAITVMLIAHVFGQTILNRILAHSNEVSQLWSLLHRLRFLYSIVLLSVLFALIFRIFPTQKASAKHCFLGGLAVAASWSVFSWLFSLYVNHFASHQKLYGGIGLLILILIWLHICIIILLQGGRLCLLLERSAYHPLKIFKEALQKND